MTNVTLSNFLAYIGIFLLTFLLAIREIASRDSPQDIHLSK